MSSEQQVPLHEEKVTYPKASGPALMNMLNMRYNMIRACIETCHFQKRTLAGETINHAVYECMHFCTEKYVKTYEVVLDSLNATTSLVNGSSSYEENKFNIDMESFKGVTKDE